MSLPRRVPRKDGGADIADIAATGEASRSLRLVTRLTCHVDDDVSSWLANSYQVNSLTKDDMANARQAAGLGLAAALVDISCEGRGPSQEDVFVPRKFPPEFKRDVVTVARRGDLSVNEVAADFDVAPETVRRWMRQADVDDGVKDGLTSSEQSEIVQLRRTSRRLEMESEILRRAAYFARDALPK